MGIIRRSNFNLYRWRYSLGYFGVGMLFVALLGIATFFAPLGLSESEKQSVVTSELLSARQFAPDMAINLPYYAFQKGIFFLFGVSELTIKLPSLILTFLSGIGILLLLRQWYRRNTAVLSALLALTTGPFMLIAQTGTPDILYIFWPIMLLVSGSMISAKAHFLFVWKLLFFGSLALSLYTPMMIYVVAGLIVVGLLHPHLRYQINRLSRAKVIVAVVLSLFLTGPLIYALLQSREAGLTLLGMPTLPINLYDNLGTLGRIYLDITHPTNGELITPVYGLAAMVLVCLGIYRVVTAKYTAKSYIVMAWLVLLIPILLIHPQLVSITFTPFILLVAFGIGQLIGAWYELFPKNPYARAAGLLPLVIFITSLSLAGVDRFMYGYHYSPDTAKIYSRDLAVLGRELAATKQTTTLLVTQEEAAFYRAVKHYNTGWKIENVSSKPIANKSAATIATRAARQASYGNPIKILTNGRSDEADRFYLYKPVRN